MIFSDLVMIHINTGEREWFIWIQIFLILRQSAKRDGFNESLDQGRLRTYLFNSLFNKRRKLCEIRKNILK
jgi:hypothetical protein